MTILESALAKMKAKYLQGAKEHGGEMDDAQVPLIDWLKALQEEAIDTVFYLEKIIKDMENAGLQERGTIHKGQDTRGGKEGH